MKTSFENIKFKSEVENWNYFRILKVKINTMVLLFFKTWYVLIPILLLLLIILTTIKRKKRKQASMGTDKDEVNKE